MNSNTPTILGSFLLLAQSLFFPCSLQALPDERPPDICIILVDSLRPDHLGCYGYGRDTSPFHDSFAAEGTLFEEAVASAPWTQPSVMTLFTSVEPGVHHRAAWQDEPDTNLVTLAGALRAAGYQTAGFTSNPLTNRKYGYARGFDVYDDFSACAAPRAAGMAGPLARPGHARRPPAGAPGVWQNFVRTDRRRIGWPDRGKPWGQTRKNKMFRPNSQFALLIYSKRNEC